MTNEKLLAAIDRIQYLSCDETVGLDISVGQCNKCPTCHTIMALRRAVMACQDWEKRGSYCIPINEILDVIKEEVDERKGI